LSGNITKEHGLGEHFIFIKKIFPQAVIFPIVVKPRKFIGNIEWINMLSGYVLQGKTMIIASVDFSHYVNEDFAKLHDKKSLYVLNTANATSEYNSIEADCPSCLHIINTIAQHNQYYPKLFLRDSSSEIIGKDLGTGNTSRQFIYYTPQKQEINGVTIAFFGDLIFDRQVAEILS
jgi:poly-gamma-glutamate synthesis protein (capsule biosynthesis protein)